jgi:hypothetical protein
MRTNRRRPPCRPSPATAPWVPAYRAASKAASQARWLAKPENQGYFRGPVSVARVKELASAADFLSGMVPAIGVAARDDDPRTFGRHLTVVRGALVTSSGMVEPRVYDAA